MWKKPWTMKEGFVISVAIAFVGVILQLATGSVVWDAFVWPVNTIVLAAFLLAITVIFLVRRNSYLIHYLTTHRAAIPALVVAAALTIVMGLTRQNDSGFWWEDMASCWPFVLIFTYIAFLLGQLTLRRISHFVYFHHRHPHSEHRPWLRDTAFVLNHGGLFITLVCATLGNPDVHRARMIVTQGETVWRAMDDRQRTVPLPFGVELQRFILETYPDGSPRRFASELKFVKQNKQQKIATVEVNHPLNVQGWKVYQYSYDTQAGAASQVSVLELVRDPWLPYVYTGIFMMLAGALLMFFDKSYSAKGLTDEERRKSREKERKKRQKQEAKRRLAEEFVGEGEEHHHHHHHHHHSSGDEHYHAEK